MKTCPICGNDEFTGAQCWSCGYEPLSVQKAHREPLEPIPGMERAATNIITKTTPHGFLWCMADGSHEDHTVFTQETDAVLAGMHWIKENRPELWV